MSTPPTRQVELETLVIGGGVAGLWTLNKLRQLGHNAGLIEATALGDGQTIAAQGILHGGVKYTLSGLLARGARTVAKMPETWKRHLNGEQAPDLRNVTQRSKNCFLWRTDSAGSIIGLAGAKLALRVRPTAVAQEDRPPILANCPGEVAALPECVLEMPSLLNELAALQPGCLLHGNIQHANVLGEANPLFDVQLPDTTRLLIRPKNVVLCAGAGNEQLMQMLKLAAEGWTLCMQRRPLHMTLVQGPPEDLPELNGHCVEGASTRVTITSATMSNGNRVWQLGGALSESGVHRAAEAQIREAQLCLQAVLPDFKSNASTLQYATYRVDRAECRTEYLGRPADVSVHRAGRTIVVWPTKMVLAPRAADRVVELLGQPQTPEAACDPPFVGLPCPPVAQPPWERATWS